MDEQQFCQQVLSQIKHATPEEKTAIRQEMLDHMEDHADALKELGYDEALARERTMDSMGEPEEIGREISKSYPLHWLVLSRASLIVAVILGIYLFMMMPVLGNIYANAKARWGEMDDYGNLSEYQNVQVLDLRCRYGDDTLRVYRSAVKRSFDSETGYCAAVAVCNYDTDFFGIAAQSAAATFETSAGTQESRSGGGGSNGGVHTWMYREIAVPKGEETLTVNFDQYGQHASFEVPLDWEGVK